ncbi:unnamed protein product [Lactuca virosa]|uniref:GRAM domain-containing protein n=1 Tax=Lactuca virosa TaxID=75947 RepID=A0AAU9LJK6_9ASTR|nr:unnamed protein product [Lactuca virosa]
MDPRFLQHVMGIPIRSSTKGLLSTEPYQPHCPLSTTSSKINGIERKDSFAVWIKDYVSLGPKLIEIMKDKLNHGAKIFQFGSQRKPFRKRFSIKEEEKLLQASQCCLYTTAGAIAGVLFVSTERVAFCSDRTIITYSRTGELVKFQYKVSIPLGKIKGVEKSVNMKRTWSNCVEIVTIDDFNFWLGLINYKKILRYLHHATSHDCLCKLS